jgi:Tol biopolymer transport system component
VAAGTLLPSAAAPAWAGTTELVSISSSGVPGNRQSRDVAISAHGRFIAFSSNADNLVPDDLNATTDIFVRDRTRGTTERVSVSSTGEAGDLFSGGPSISTDGGRFVTFWSMASNLVPGDTNNAGDVFVHDRKLGTTELVSVSPTGEPGNDDSGSEIRGQSISADGRFIAFVSGASNIASGRGVIVVRDRKLRTSKRIGRPLNREPVSGFTSLGAISANGRFVTFNSSLSNLVVGDTNNTHDVFVHDRKLGITERVSVSSTGEQGNDSSFAHDISANGRFVTFVSEADNLVNGTTGRCNSFVQCVFVRDRKLGTTELVSVSPTGAPANRLSSNPSISADGRLVAFMSWADNLVPGDTNTRCNDEEVCTGDVFVRNRRTSTTQRVNLASGGSQANGSSGDFGVAISADGRFVTFDSSATNLVPNDTKNASDVFVHVR